MIIKAIWRKAKNIGKLKNKIFKIMHIQNNR